MKKQKNNSNKKVLLALLSLFIIFFGGFILVQEYTLNAGEEIFLKTIPVDPRDYLRGDYVILSYELQRDKRISHIVNQYNLSDGENIYFILEKDENKKAVLLEITLQKPNSGLFIKGKVDSNSQTRTNTDLGIHKYFVPEGRGYEIERLREELEVLVVIDSFGNVIIKDIYYNETKIDFK